LIRPRGRGKEEKRCGGKGKKKKEERGKLYRAHRYYDGAWAHATIASGNSLTFEVIYLESLWTAGSKLGGKRERREKKT